MQAWNDMLSLFWSLWVLWQFSIPYHRIMFRTPITFIFLNSRSRIPTILLNLWISINRLVEELWQIYEVKCPRPTKEWKRFPNKCQIPRAAEKLFFVSNLPLKGSQQKEGNIYLSCPTLPCKRCHAIFQLLRMRTLISWINPTSEKLRNKLLSNFNTQTSRLG